MSEKKIRISLDDAASSGVKRFSDNTQKSVEGIADAYDKVDGILGDLVDDSKKYSKSIEDRVKLIDKEIQTQQRAAKIDSQERKTKVEHDKRIIQDKNKLSKEEEVNQQKKKRGLDEEKRDEDLHFQKLRARYEQSKNDRKEEKDDKEKSKAEHGHGGGEEGEEHEGGILHRIGHGIKHGLHSVAHGALEGAGFGAVLSIAGFIGKLIDEGSELDEASHRMSGVTGRHGMVGGAAFGQKESAFMNYATNVAIASGSADAGAKDARAQLAFEKGFGLSIGSTLGNNRVFQASDSNFVDSQLQMLNIMKKSDLYNIRRGDFTKLGDLIERGNTLNEMQAAQREQIDTTNTSLLMAGFGKVGGSFGDFRQVQTMSGINQALTNPDNDFKQAFLLRTLRKQNPNSSFLDLKMKQEEGIFGKGTFEGVLGDLSNTFSGDQLTFSASKMLGISLHQAKRLMDYHKTNPNAFKDIRVGSSKELGDMIEGGFNRESLMERGAEHTGTIERWKAGFDTKMGRWGSKAIAKVAEYEKAFDEGGFGGLMSKMGSDITEAIGKGFDMVLAELPGTKQNREKKLNEEYEESHKAQKEFEHKIGKAYREATGKSINEKEAVKKFESEFDKRSRANSDKGDYHPMTLDEFKTFLEEQNKKVTKVEIVSKEGSKNNTYQPTHKGHN